MRSIRAVHAETRRETFTPSTLMTALDFLGLNLKTTRRKGLAARMSLGFQEHIISLLSFTQSPTAITPMLTPRERTLSAESDVTPKPLLPLARPDSDRSTKWYVASDGTSFVDRDHYRKYEMETQYTYRDKKGVILSKSPGSIHGMPFVIDGCHKCKILLIDTCEQVTIDDVTDSKIFVGASSGSIFIRNCQNCTFTIACKQFRASDCRTCTFNLFCSTEPAIEASQDLKFGPHNGAYPGHEKDMIAAGLDPAVNMWFKVYDFDDTFKGLKTTIDIPKTTCNWRYLRPEEQGPMWCPLGIAKSCIPLSFPPALNESKHEVSEETQKCVVNEISRKELDRIVASVNVETLTSDDAPSETKSIESSASPTEDGFLYKIKVLGFNVWTFLSATVRSVQNGCLRIVYGAMLLPHKLLSSRQPKVSENVQETDDQLDERMRKFSESRITDLEGL